jgi:uncharacterized protein (DUF1499 family)
MGLFRWLTRNWASTQGPTHSDLAPLVLPLPPAEAIERVKAAVAERLPHWTIGAPTAENELHLTRQTLIMKFVDDIRLRFLPAGPGCLIHAESKCRVGIGDFGQNRRNILELWDVIRALQ